MRRLSIIDSTQTVVNVIKLKDGVQWAPPEGLSIGPSGGEIGDQWNGSDYIKPSVAIEPAQEAEPAPPADPTVAALQAKIAAMQAQIQFLAENALASVEIKES